MELKDRIERAQKKVSEAKQEKARLEGREQELMARLKKEFGCTSIKAAEKKLNSLQRDIQQAEQTIARGLGEIEEELGWA